MAQVFDPLAEQEEQNQEEGQQPQQVSGGESASVQPQSGGGIQPGQGVKGTTSGRFTNIQNYIQGNRQASQGLAQNLGQKVTQSVESTKQNIGKSAQATEQDLKSVGDAVKAQQEAAKQSVAKLAQYEAAPDLNLEEEATRLQGGLSTGYKDQVGNINLKDQQNLLKSVQDIQEVGKSTANDAGREALVTRYLGNPQYNKGQKRLDTLLLGGTKENLAELGKARQATRTLNPELQRTEEAILAKKQAATQELDAQREALNKSIADQTSQFSDEELAAMQQQAMSSSGLIPQGMQDGLVTEGPGIPLGGKLAPNQTLAQRLQLAAQQANIQNQQDASQFTEDEIRTALGDAQGLLNIKGNKVEILPGSGTYVDINQLAPGLAAQAKMQANLQNINPEALGRLNLLRTLSGQAELAGSDQFQGGVNNQISDQFKSNLQKLRSQVEAKGGLKAQQNQMLKALGNAKTSDIEMISRMGPDYTDKIRFNGVMGNDNSKYVESGLRILGKDQAWMNSQIKKAATSEWVTDRVRNAVRDGMKNFKSKAIFGTPAYKAERAAFEKKLKDSYTKSMARGRVQDMMADQIRDTIMKTGAKGSNYKFGDIGQWIHRTGALKDSQAKDYTRSALQNFIKKNLASQGQGDQ